MKKYVYLILVVLASTLLVILFSDKNDDLKYVKQTCINEYGIPVNDCVESRQVIESGLPFRWITLNIVSPSGCDPSDSTVSDLPFSCEEVVGAYIEGSNKFPYFDANINKIMFLINVTVVSSVFVLLIFLLRIFKTKIPNKSKPKN